MAFAYKNEAMVDGEFGPNTNKHKYHPMPYHGCNARPKKGKTRWDHPAAAEYHVFNLADEHSDKKEDNGDVDKRWMNDDGSGLYSMVNGCSEPLGKDEERLAFFPTPQNENDPWHGYPIGCDDIGDNLIEHWHDAKLIDDTAYSRLLRRKL